MKLVCKRIYGCEEDEITEGKIYEGEISHRIITGLKEYSFYYFITFNNKGMWKHYDISSFEPIKEGK